MIEPVSAPARNAHRRPRRGRPGRIAGVTVLGALGLLGAAAPAGAATSPTVQVVHNKTWGPILELSNGRAVYLFAKDTAGHSNCSGACAKAWPPVLVPKGDHPTGHGVSHLGTIHRAGGQLQLTYEGMPLYTFTGDKHAGQVNGNVTDKYGQWWAVDPTHPHTAPSAASSGSTHPATGPGSAPAGGY